MPYRYYYISALFFLVFSCSDEPKELVVERECLIFNLGFPTPKERFTDVFYSEGKELVYFVDATTTKQIKFFDLNGALNTKIQLDSLSKRGEKLMSFNVFSMDSIFILTSYTNRAFHLNKQGEIWKEFKLDTIINEVSSNCDYKLTSSLFSSMFINRKSVILNSVWRYKFTEEDYETMTKQEFSRTLNDSKFNLPYFVKIDDIFKPKMFKFGIPLKKIIFPNEDLSDSTSYVYNDNYNYSIIDDTVFVKSKYSNKIFKVDSNLKLTDTINIFSKHTKIGAPRPQIRRNMDFQKSFDTNKLNGALKNLIFNKQEQKYYLVVLKKITPEFYEEHQYRPWILQSYNSKFELLKETEFNNNAYNFNLLNLNDGVYIQKVDTTEINSYDDYKVTFEKYSF